MELAETEALHERPRHPYTPRAGRWLCSDVAEPRTGNAPRKRRFAAGGAHGLVRLARAVDACSMLCVGQREYGITVRDDSLAHDFGRAHGEMSDSIFMGASILAAVGELTGERRYFDMAARHIEFMNGLVRRDDGLYRHSESTAMSKYVDGFVVPVPKTNVEAYRRIAQQAGEIWLEHGPLEFLEFVAEDVKPGEHTSFPQSVKLEADETVVFAWIVYASRAERDRINEQVMKDPRLTMGPDGMPFDAKRMIFGGFEPIVELRRGT